MTRLIFVLITLSGLPLLAQNGCGSTLNWTSPVCQQIGSGILNATNWSVISRHGEYSQSETECNIPNAVSVTGGNLVITAFAASYTCGDFNGDGTVQHAAASWPYSTGDVQWNTFNFTYGSVAFSATYPDPGTKLWPSHWLLGSNCQSINKYTGQTISPCPSIGSTGYDEIDMIECYSNICEMNIYHGTSPAQHCQFPSPTWDANPHSWLMTWLPNSLTLSRDGVQICSLSGNIPSQPMFLIIQTQTGGIGGTPVSSQLPATLRTGPITVKNQAGNVIFSDTFSSGSSGIQPPSLLNALVE